MASSSNNTFNNLNSDDVGGGGGGGGANKTDHSNNFDNTEMMIRVDVAQNPTNAAGVSNKGYGR